MARICEDCGIKMPAFKPRKRTGDGKLLCDGCHPDGRGQPGRPVGHHGGSLSRNDVIRQALQKEAWEPHGKSKVFPPGTQPAAIDAWINKNVPKKARDQIERSTSTDGTTVISVEWGSSPPDPAKFVRDLEWDAMVPDAYWNVTEYVLVSDLQVGDKVALSHNSDGRYLLPDAWTVTTLRGIGGTVNVERPGSQPHPLYPGGMGYDKRPNMVTRFVPKGGKSWDEADRYQRAASINPTAGVKEWLERVDPDIKELDDEGPGPWEKKHAMRFEAHDSGDGKVIYHCPFCGGGEVVGRSDGTAMCDFCSTAFTVQVQPERSAMPQTNPITGEPLNMPGMPGDPSAPDATPPGGAGGEQGTAPPGAGPPPGPPPGGGQTPATPPPGPPPGPAPMQAAASYYVVSEGVLDEDAFIKHLAIKYADDKAGVIESVRNTNRRS